MVLAHNINDRQRTQDVCISQDTTFDMMLMSETTLEGLKKSGFYKPSPIQLHGIPLGKCGFDLLLEAKSGTGKTAVFSVIALEKLDLKKGLQTVILAPTREIAAQICDVMKQIGSVYEGLNVEVVMGGLPVQEDIAKFKNKQVHIVVGSPGRLRNLIQEKHIDVDTVRLLVLDEADKLMEKSFLPDINYIFSVLPKQKQVIMSSATYPTNTKTFIDRYVQSAQHICPDTSSILLGIEQKITTVKYNVNVVKQTKHRFEELLKILAQKQFKQCLIFCNYQVRVAELHKMLSRKNWPAEQLYGQQEQTDRLDALKTLQEYKCRILVSTDLAARGIDASNVDLVINFEPPLEWQTYLHRIGRAGRYGSYGMAITILSEGKEYKRFTEMLGILGPSINLNNFWDDSNVQETNLPPLGKDSVIPAIDSSVEPILIDDKYDTLWKIYTNDSLNYTNEIESFEKLCSSFEQAETDKIETFSDLLNSFESHDNADVEISNITYRHLQVPSIPTKDYLNWIRYLCGDEKNECDMSTLDENGKATENKPISKEKSEDVMCNGNNKTEKKNIYVKNSTTEEDENINEKTFEDTKCNKNNSVISNENQLLNRSYVNNQEDNNINEIEFKSMNEEALLQAGLPISFGSSINKHRKPIRHKKCSYLTKTAREGNVGNDMYPKNKQTITNTAQYTSDTDESERAITTDDFEYHTFKLKKNQKLFKTDESEIILTSDNYEKSNSVKKNKSKSKKYKLKNHAMDSKSSADVGDYQDYEYKMSHLQRKSPSVNKKDKGNRHDKNGYHSHSFNYSNLEYESEILTSPNHKRNYMDWYNQLKYMMRQIEFAVYIEELSSI